MVEMTIVVLDAANVVTISPGNLRIERLDAALDCFEKVNIRCIAFAPRFWLDGNQHFQDTESKAKLKALVDNNKLILTPPQAHDDFYVIDYATKHDGYIVTNDMFRDHVLYQRRFNGQALSAEWVKSHCIDFTFVGDEFLPNSQAMDRVLNHVPTKCPSACATVKSKPVTDEIHSEDMQCDMDVDMDEMHAPTQKRIVVDMSEAVYIQVPLPIVNILHDNDGAGLKYFQEMSGTHMQLPRTVPFGKDTTTLSIYGNRECCERAMHAVHAFLHEYVASQNDMMIS